MIKKIVILLLLLNIFSYASEGNFDKGLTYYKFIILPLTNIKGSTFTKNHTANEWKELFKNDAVGFKKKYSSLNKEFATFLQSKKFTKISSDIESFFIAYSKDSSATPQCGE